MSMSKKDYVAIARILQASQIKTPRNPQYEAAAADTTREIAIRLADYFAEQNPAFDRGRFLFAALNPSVEKEGA